MKICHIVESFGGGVFYAICQIANEQKRIDKLSKKLKEVRLRKNIINQGESSAKLYQSEKLSSDLIRLYDSII